MCFGEYLMYFNTTVQEISNSLDKKFKTGTDSKLINLQYRKIPSFGRVKTIYDLFFLTK
jgi:hypothetical protein